ncbi:MAG TPA: molybdopterin-binding protein [Candidatus Bathyarchaeia archaeon]|nr:molybdopterin-binding protein [Candidatus Bathyarchaeia archaeon]
MGAKTSRAEILSIGNELLIGHTLDTNSNWIAKQLNRLGWRLERVTQLRDSIDTISSGVREALRRHEEALITLGGLGPTYDDMTLKGIAFALRKPLIINREALDSIRKRYERIGSKVALTRFRIKMATLPDGAKPIPNPIGTAPGVMVQSGQTTIFSLPGVPSEMKSIFTQSIIPFLRGASGRPPSEVQFRIVGIIESALAPILDHAQRKYPGLYFKSHPHGRETGKTPQIVLHVYNTNPESERHIAEAVRYLAKQVAEAAK